jgi:hypothetical protein
MKLPMKTIIDFNGNELNIAHFKESLMNFPSRCLKDIDTEGTPFLHNLVQRDSPCGCTIEGNGTLQFPMRIKHCKKHSK